MPEKLSIMVFSIVLIAPAAVCLPDQTSAASPTEIVSRAGEERIHFEAAIPLYGDNRVYGAVGVGVSLLLGLLVSIAWTRSLRGMVSVRTKELHLSRMRYQSITERLSYVVDGTQQDTTKRRQAEVELKAKEAELPLMIEQSPLGVCINSLGGTFVSANPAYEAPTGYTEEELKNLTFFDITPPDDRPENRRLFQGMTFKKTVSFRMKKRYIRKDGSEIFVIIHAGPRGTHCRAKSLKRRPPASMRPSCWWKTSLQS